MVETTKPFPFKRRIHNGNVFWVEYTPRGNSVNKKWGVTHRATSLPLIWGRRGPNPIFPMIFLICMWRSLEKNVEGITLAHYPLPILTASATPSEIEWIIGKHKKLL